MYILKLNKLFIPVFFLTALLAQVSYSQIVQVETSPSCNFKTDGIIELIVNEDSVAFSLPYTISWENITTGGYQDGIKMNDYEFTLDDLYPGDYEITIYFDSACKYFIETEVLELETESILFIKKPIQPTCGSSDGKITLFPVEEESGTPPLNFNWSHGGTTKSLGNPPSVYFVSNLIEGNYCVTVTDQACGYSKFCIPLESKYPIVTINNIEQISNCEFEPYDCTGLISLSISGVENYTVKWLDPNRDSIGSGNTISNLCDPGNYLAIITFSPNCQPFIYSFDVPCCSNDSSNFEVELIVEQGCNNESSIETNVSGGISPYTYIWSNQSQSANLYDIGYGEYHVTVTDSTGCITKDSVNLTPIEKLYVINACEGYFDGSISFRINNPSNCPVDVNYNFSICSDCTGYPLIEDDTSTQITITLEDLGGGLKDTFWVHMCDCIIPFAFTIPEDPWDKSYINHIDHGNYTFECYYDLDCKDNHIDTGQISLARIDLTGEEVDCEGLFSKDCGSSKYYCEDELVAEKDIKAKIMRRMRAVFLAQVLGYDQSLINNTVGNGSPCDWVSVCPNDPTCVHGTAHGEWGGHYLGPQTLSNGCIRFRCKIAGLISTSYTVCGLEFIPDYYAAYYDPSISISLNLNTTNCNPIEKNVGELIMYLDSLSYDHPNDFYNSSLYIFLIQHIGDERKWCATVKYCTSDYSFLDSNIDEVDCAPIDPPLQTGGPGPIDRACAPYTGTDSLFYVFCNSPCPDPRPGIVCGPQPKVFVNNYQGFNPVGFAENHPIFQLMARMEGPSYFGGFLPIKQNKTTFTPNALYEDNGVKLHHQFSYESWNPYELERLEYLFQDVDTSYAFGIVQDSQNNNAHDIVFGDIGEINESKLVGSSALDLSKMWSNDSLHFITGEFSDSMELGSIPIATSATNRFFILSVDRDLSVNAIRQVNLNGWNVFVDEETADLALWSASNQGLYIDGQLQSNISTGEIITLDGSSSNSTIRDINLIIPSTMNLLEYKRGDAYSSYLLAGSGSVTKNGTKIYYSSSSKLILLTINNSGAINWYKDYSLSAIDTSEITLETVDGDSIFLGLNIIADITIEGDSIINNGGRDILIIGYNSTGTLIRSEHYGSPSKEIVKDLFYSNGVLYLGGEIDQNTFRRQIGELNFVNFSPDYGQGYISYILLDEPVQSESSLFETSVNSIDELNQSVIEVFPNPAENQVNVRVTHKCDNVQVFLMDVSGKAMTIISSNSESLKKGVIFDISEFPSGIYFVNVVSDCSRLISRPFIKIE